MSITTRTPTVEPGRESHNLGADPYRKAPQSGLLLPRWEKSLPSGLTRGWRAAPDEGGHKHRVHYLGLPFPRHSCPATGSFPRTRESLFRIAPRVLRVRPDLQTEIPAFAGMTGGLTIAIHQSPQSLDPTYPRPLRIPHTGCTSSAWTERTTNACGWSSRVRRGSRPEPWARGRRMNLAAPAMEQ
jgi:hypothetical protein